MSCLIKNSEYWTKLALSGIPESIFYKFANNFVAKYGRFPNLDEMPLVNSSQHLKETLYVDEQDSTNIQDILNITQSNNISEANIKLNDIYTDLEVKLLPLNETALVNIQQRPSEYLLKESEEFEPAININQTVVFNLMFDKLRNFYGISIIPITDKELKEYLPEVKNVSAFIHEGNIYVNTDQANIDAPIHEMTHILLGSIRFKNPKLYEDLISMAENFKNLPVIKLNNPNRTYSDILEEAFVEEVSKYLSGMTNSISALDSSIRYELHYNIKRLLDSVLMGQFSVKSINNNELYLCSLVELAQMVNSLEFSTNSMLSIDDASMHRILSNLKQELMEKNELKEEC